MGRSKIKIEKINCQRMREITLEKRKKGLIKKAMELSILCDTQVLVSFIDRFGKCILYHTTDNHISFLDNFVLNMDYPQIRLSDNDYDCLDKLNNLIETEQKLGVKYELPVFSTVQQDLIEEQKEAQFNSMLEFFGNGKANNIDCIDCKSEKSSVQGMNLSQNNLFFNLSTNIRNSLRSLSSDEEKQADNYLSLSQSIIDTTNLSKFSDSKLDTPLISQISANHKKAKFTSKRFQVKLKDKISAESWITINNNKNSILQDYQEMDKSSEHNSLTDFSPKFEFRFVSASDKTLMSQAEDLLKAKSSHSDILSRDELQLKLYDDNLNIL